MSVEETELYRGDRIRSRQDQTKLIQTRGNKFKAGRQTRKVRRNQTTDQTRSQERTSKISYKMAKHR